MDKLVYVLTMTDRDEDYNNGVYNAVFRSYDKARAELLKWVDEEVEAGIVSRDDLIFNDEKDYWQTRNGRFAWTIDEKEVM